jgi:hypothetical protein
MAQSLSISIALAGGDLVAKQLADIGEAGQKAFADISKSAEQVGGFKGLDPTAVTQKLKELGVTGVDEINKIQAAVEKAAMFEKLAQGIQVAETALKALGIAAGVSLGGIGAAIIALIPKTIEWAKSIEEMNAQATKMGTTVQQFDALRQGLERAGVSAKDAATAMEKIGQASEKAQIDKVTQAFKELQDAATRGSGAQGTSQLQILEQAAAGVGKAAELARQDLEKLGLPIPTNIPQTLDQLIAKFGDTRQGLEAFVNQLAAMPAGLQRDQVAFDQLGQAGLQLSQALANGSITAAQFKEGISALITDQQVQSAGALTQAINQLSQAWNQLMQGGGGAGLLAEGIGQVTQLIQNLNNLVITLKGSFDQLSNTTFGNAIIEVLNAIAAALNTVNQTVQALASNLRNLIGLAGQGSIRNLPGEAAGHAAGGLIGGSGTGTSDSNLAWVSRGEHIMPARAVAQPGVLAFLEALRSSGGNLRAVLDGLGRFAMGGPVPRSIPAFAGGGLVGMHPVTLNFTNGPTIAGLRAPSVVVEELKRASVLDAVRSGGRKPSRYT